MKILLASSWLKNSNYLRFKILKIHVFRCFYDLTDDMTQLMLIFCHLSRVVSRANYFRKTGGCPESEVPKQEHAKNFQNDEITDKDSSCSKQLKLIENRRNKPNYRSANKFLFVQTRTSDHYFSLSLQRLSCGLVRN